MKTKTNFAMEFAYVVDAIIMLERGAVVRREGSPFTEEEVKATFQRGNKAWRVILNEFYRMQNKAGK